VGAISIFDKKPENSMPLPPDEMGTYMEQLITSHRSCRRFLDKNVEPELLSRILSAMAAAPTGGNAQGVEYTVIDDKDRVHEIGMEFRKTGPPRFTGIASKRKGSKEMYRDDIEGVICCEL
jgi:nitroreductase